MRCLLLLPLLLALAACSVSEGTRLDERTFRVEGPRMGVDSTGPNRRLAEKLCPKGYRVLDEKHDKDNYAGGTSTTWIVRCL